jgi:hypothetical protein
MNSAGMLAGFGLASCGGAGRSDSEATCCPWAADSHPQPPSPATPVSPRSRSSAQNESVIACRWVVQAAQPRPAHRAVNQIRRHGSAGRAYYDAKIADGKTEKEARRCVNAAWPTIFGGSDPRSTTASSGSGRTTGGDSAIQRGWLNPYRQLFGQVTSRTRHPDSTTRQTAA